MRRQRQRRAARGPAIQAIPAPEPEPGRGAARSNATANVNPRYASRARAPSGIRYVRAPGSSLHTTSSPASPASERALLDPVDHVELGAFGNDQLWPRIAHHRDRQAIRAEGLRADREIERRPACRRLLVADAEGARGRQRRLVEDRILTPQHSDL